MKLTVNDRIKQRRKELDLDADYIAQQLGISRATYYRYESKEIEKIPISALAPLAKILRTTPQYLMGWSDEKSNSIFEKIFPIETQSVPMLGKIACGKPIMSDEIFSGYVQCGAQIRADFCLRAEGDSMIGARIYDGDIVFIRQQPEVENGEIAAVAIDDSVTLKRVYVSEDYIELVAENPKFKPMRIRKEDAENVKILGKAVAFQGDVI